MERQEILEPMSTLKLAGMRAAYDEMIAARRSSGGIPCNR